MIFLERDKLHTDLKYLDDSGQNKDSRHPIFQFRNYPAQEFLSEGNRQINKEQEQNEGGKKYPATEKGRVHHGGKIITKIEIARD